MTRKLDRRMLWRDAISAGPAHIAGVVRELTVPVAGRQVLLFDQDTFALRRETRSGAGGAYQFQNVAAGRTWMVLAIDPTGAYNAVIADRVQT